MGMDNKGPFERIPPEGSPYLPLFANLSPCKKCSIPLPELSTFLLFLFLREEQRGLEQVPVHQQLQRAVLELHHTLGDIQP